MKYWSVWSRANKIKEKQKIIDEQAKTIEKLQDELNQARWILANPLEEPGYHADRHYVCHPDTPWKGH